VSFGFSVSVGNSVFFGFGFWACLGF